MRQRARTALIATAVATLGTVPSLLLTAPAASAAGTYDHRFPNEVPGGCSSSQRVGAATSLYTANGRYYGWGEFRYGTSGACLGYQWIKLHFTRTLYTDSSGIEMFVHRGPDRSGGVAITTQLRTTRYAAGTWTQSQVLYSSGAIRSGTAYADSPVGKVTFGTRGHQYEWLEG